VNWGEGNLLQVGEKKMTEMGYSVSEDFLKMFSFTLIQGYRFIKKHSLSTEEMYGLELANVEVERVPIMVGPAAKVRVKREREDRERAKEARYHGHE